jgi:ribosome maturation factor RimP
MNSILSERTTQELRAIAAEAGCRLLAIESTGAGRASVLRLVIERTSGEPVTVEDCEAVSRDVSTVLDAADEIPHRYTLEVSSAGLDRKLYELEDAVRFVGRRVRVQTSQPIRPVPAEEVAAEAAAAPARNFRGVLERVDGDLLRVVDGANRKIYNVRFGDIRVARLEFDWPARGR